MQKSIKSFRFKRSIKLYCLTDVHIGNKAHDKEKFNKIIKLIKNDPDAYCFFNGDNFDFTPPGHHDATNEQDLTLQEQIDNFQNLVKFLGKKVLFIRSGNHEARMQKALDVDLIRLLGKQNNVKVIHEGYEEVWIFVKSKKFRLVTSHGEGGGSRPTLSKLTQIFPGADIYFTGHTHEFFADVTYSPIMTDTGKMVQKLVLKLCGGSFQGMADYARTRNMIPTQTGCYVIKLTKNDLTYKGIF